jgi:hypothetical protein
VETGCPTRCSKELALLVHEDAGRSEALVECCALVDTPSSPRGEAEQLIHNGGKRGVAHGEAPVVGLPGPQHPLCSLCWSLRKLTRWMGGTRAWERAAGLER